MSPGRVLIGTSGWHYRHWQGSFYPSGIKPTEQLRFYAEHFDTVEVNGTFYRLIAKEVLQRWRESTPEGFVFACKASRFLTHSKRLKDTDLGLRRFFEPLEALGDKLGPILFQLPGNFRPDLERLASFLDALPGGGRYAFEFRNPAWFERDVFDLLAARGVALCLYDFEGRQAPSEITANFVYVRLHGPTGRYQGSYDDATLATWAERISRWRARGLDVYCYFDNDEKAYAPGDASRLQRILRASAT
jgi:uncharacterized protein YecE (DUF72 family)